FLLLDLPAREGELPLERALEELEDGVVPGQVLVAGARDVALEEEDLGDLVLPALLGDDQGARLVRADQGLDDRGHAEEFEVALPLLARARPRHLQRRGLEPARENDAEVAR